MNNLETVGQVRTISSREVAEMMEIEHGKLLRKIDGLSEDFNQAKIGLVKYWMESSYTDKKGEQRRCFQVTKLGCEFLAHKTTGKKGTLFTARYMDKFEEMKQELQHRSSYMIADPIERAKAWIREEEERRLLAQTVEEQRPKVEYHDAVLNSDKLVTTTDIAKDLGMSARALNQRLNELGIIFKQGKCWKLYAKHQDKLPQYCDYHINEYGQSLKWTEQGRKWIIELLG